MATQDLQWQQHNQWAFLSDAKKAETSLTEGCRCRRKTYHLVVFCDVSNLVDCDEVGETISIYLFSLGKIKLLLMPVSLRHHHHHHQQPKLMLSFHTSAIVVQLIYLSEQDYGVWGDVVVGPDFFHGTYGYRDRVNSLYSSNQLLVAAALLALKKKKGRVFDFVKTSSFYSKDIS